MCKDLVGNFDLLFNSCGGLANPAITGQDGAQFGGFHSELCAR